MSTFSISLADWEISNQKLKQISFSPVRSGLANSVSMPCFPSSARASRKYPEMNTLFREIRRIELNLRNCCSDPPEVQRIRLSGTCPGSWQSRRTGCCSTLPPRSNRTARPQSHSQAACRQGALYSWLWILLVQLPEGCRDIHPRAGTGSRPRRRNRHPRPQPSPLGR